MTDLSNTAPIEARQRHQRKCTAHKRNGKPCERWAIAGGFVCPSHGGRAPQIKRKARQRLEEASDRMAKALLNMASDENVAEPVRLAAIKDALSRAGISEKAAVEVEVALRPFDQISDAVAGSLEITSRTDWRRSQGIEDDDEQPPALADLATLDAPVDAEVVDDDTFAARVALRRVNDLGVAETYDDDQQPPDERTAPGTDTPASPTGGPSGGMMPFTDAVVAAAAQRRNAARVHPVRRALPPGPSR